MITAGNADGGGTDDFGGGMLNDESAPTIRNCVFFENIAEKGGGIYNMDSQANLEGCTFRMNVATEAGDEMFNDNSPVQLRDSIFFGNRSLAGNGGGLRNWNSSPTLVNCLIVGNVAGDDGGGLANRHASPTLINCTVADNSAIFGGGMANSGSPTLPVITNTIIWNNIASEGEAIHNYESTTDVPTIRYSNIEGSGDSGASWDPLLGFDGGGNIDGNPHLVGLGTWDDNGTSGDWRDDTWGTGEYELLPNSPCIDAGDNAAVPAGVSEDINGRPRLLDVPSVPDSGNGSSPIVDMGAYESDHLPRTLYVDNNSADGTWAGAYADLQDALAMAYTGDEIWVAAGTYTPTDTGDQTISFEIVEGVEIYGGFVGGETSRDHRDWLANETTLSGDLNGDDGPDYSNLGDNATHVVLGADNAVLDGFTITAGIALGITTIQADLVVACIICLSHLPSTTVFLRTTTHCMVPGCITRHLLPS